eukprot:SAG22_NODE_177_length_16160_cov_41.299296_8_plen_73_part_00
MTHLCAAPGLQCRGLRHPPTVGRADGRLCVTRPPAAAGAAGRRGQRPVGRALEGRGLPGELREDSKERHCLT